MNLEKLGYDVLCNIIILCDFLSKYILHFVSRKFRYLTLDNEENRELKVSYVYDLLVRYISKKDRILHDENNIVYSTNYNKTLHMLKINYFYYIDINIFASKI